MKENDFTLKKARSKRYPAETDADDAADIALLADKPTLNESLLHALKIVVSGIGFNVNAVNEYMCFNKK